MIDLLFTEAYYGFIFMERTHRRYTKALLHIEDVVFGEGRGDEFLGQ